MFIYSYGTLSVLKDRKLKIDRRNYFYIRKLTFLLLILYKYQDILVNIKSVPDSASKFISEFFSWFSKKPTKHTHIKDYPY